MSMPGASEQRSKLLPYQEAFIDQFFSDSSSRAHLLRSEPGLGASYTTAHLVQRTIAMTPDARVLILAPKALQAQMQDILLGMGVNAQAVDRFRYREMQDSAPSHGAVWPAGMVFILSVDFAKQNDITLSLTGVPWTLLIVQEAHSSRGLRSQMVRQVVTSSPNLRVLLTSAAGTDYVPILGIEHLETTVWRRTIAVDHTGKVMFPRTVTQVELLDFHETPADQFLREFIEEIADKFPKTSSAVLVSTLFRRTLASSPPALEESVRRLRNRLAPGFLAPAPLEGDDGDKEDVSTLPPAMPEDAELVAVLNECLTEIDRFPGDSKFEVFLAKVMEIRSDNSVPFSLAIVTEYRATLFYLQAQLEELGFKTNILHGGMKFDERMQSVDRFKADGGVLIATAATMMEGVDLSQVEKLVLYDLPTSKPKLEQIYGRFQRFGRNVPLKLSVLYNLDDANSNAAKSVDNLKEIVATE